jgi:NTE family protein
MALTSNPRIGIALGGGSARGLGHISFVEAMDELGLAPAVIAGTSIGSLIGAGWADSMRGADLREHALETLGDFRAFGGKLWSTQWRGFTNMLREGISMQLNAEEVIRHFVPGNFPKTFETLRIPLHVVATDLRGWNRVVFHTGELLPAIAASIAIPSVFKPVSFHHRLMVDGGVVNPLPLDIADGGTDILVGIDGNGEPHRPRANEIPSAIDVGLGAAQIMMHTLTAYAIAESPPDLYFRPHVGAYGAHEFWRVREILEESDKDKDRFKRELSAKVEAFIAGQQKTS